MSTNTKYKLNRGDEVVWIKPGCPLSLDRLDIGKIRDFREPTYSTYSKRKKDVTFVEVEFYDYQKDAIHIQHNGHTIYILNIDSSQLCKLGDFLENINTNSTPTTIPKNPRLTRSKSGRPLTLPTATSATIASSVSNVNPNRPYLARACTLAQKIVTSHPVLTESSEIMHFDPQSRVVGGLVMRLFTSEGVFYIGAEFELEVYVNELRHMAKCPMRSNGCNRRVAINIVELTKKIWETEFLLISSLSRKTVLLEDLFFKDNLDVEDPPPSYTAATATSIAVPSAPYFVQPNTPSPSAPYVFDLTAPYKIEAPFQNWQKFQGDLPRSGTGLYPDLGQSQDQNLQNPSSRTEISQNPVTVSIPTTPAPQQNPRHSLLVQELQSRLKISPNPTSRPPPNPKPTPTANLPSDRPEQLPTTYANESESTPTATQPSTGAVGVGITSQILAELRLRNTRSSTGPIPPKPLAKPIGQDQSPTSDQKSRPTSLPNSLSIVRSNTSLPSKPKPTLLPKPKPQISPKPLKPGFLTPKPSLKPQFQFPAKPEVVLPQLVPLPAASEQPPPLPPKKQDVQHFQPEPNPVQPVSTSISSSRLSRVNLPPPPPPPPMPISGPGPQDLQNPDHFLPPPPPEWLEQSDDPNYDRGQTPNTLTQEKSPLAGDRSTLLEEIRQGIQLKSASDTTDNGEKGITGGSSEGDGFASIIMGAIQNRRTMIDNDSEESDSDFDTDEYDDASDAWD